MGEHQVVHFAGMAFSIALSPFVYYGGEGRPEPMQDMMAVIANAIEKI